jgi:hypothetical protein
MFTGQHALEVSKAISFRLLHCKQTTKALAGRVPHKDLTVRPMLTAQRTPCAL